MGIYPNLFREDVLYYMNGVTCSLINNNRTRNLLCNIIELSNVFSSCHKLFITVLPILQRCQLTLNIILISCFLAFLKDNQQH